MATTRSAGRARPSSQVLVGIVIVLVGLALLLGTTGLYETGPLLRYVPSLFVVVGLYALWVSRLRNVFGPLVVILVAGTWQLVALGVVTAASAWTVWPVFVIVFGLSLLLGRLRPRVETTEQDSVNLFALFAGRNQRVTSRDFQGGDVAVLFGGAEVDLRDADISTPPATISATALFGGVEVVVPRDWNVRVDVLPVFGAAEDERPRSDAVHDTTDLVVTGFTAFGGVSVKD